MGYPDDIFVERVNDVFNCLICQEVVRDPVECRKCNKLYCRDCSEQVLNRGHSTRCPACRQEFDTEQANRSTRIILQEAKTKCVKEGCQWTGVLEFYEKHMNEQHDGVQFSQNRAQIQHIILEMDSEDSNGVQFANEQQNQQEQQALQPQNQQKRNSLFNQEQQPVQISQLSQEQLLLLKAMLQEIDFSQETQALLQNQLSSKSKRQNTGKKSDSIFWTNSSKSIKDCFQSLSKKQFTRKFPVVDQYLKKLQKQSQKLTRRLFQYEFIFDESHKHQNIKTEMKKATFMPWMNNSENQEENLVQQGKYFVAIIPLRLQYGLIYTWKFKVKRKKEFIIGLANKDQMAMLNYELNQDSLHSFGLG